MSSASSPRSDWLSSTSRARKASKAAPVTASSGEVHVDAQPSYGASPEGRAHSRQTLHKHLSQSKLGVDSGSGRLAPSDASRPRSGSSASVNSNLSVASSSQNDLRGTLSRSPSQSGSPLASPSAPRRRSSAGPNSLQRSPSWYQSTTRKSSLALPELSTIEGSIADLRVQEAGVQEPVPASPSPTTLPDSVNMKRDRTTQDTGNPKQPKRQATGDTEAGGSFQDTKNEAVLNVEVQARESESNSAAATPDRQAANIPSATERATDPVLKTWRSYITLPRSPKPSAKGRESLSNAHATASTAAPTAAEASAGSADGNAVLQEPAPVKDQVLGMAIKVTEAAINTVKGTVTPKQLSDSSGKLDLRSFAAGTESSSSARTTTSSTPSSQQDKTSAGVKGKAEILPAKDVEPVVVAVNEEPPNGSNTLRAAPRKAEARPASWFYWTPSALMPTAGQAAPTNAIQAAHSEAVENVEEASSEPSSAIACAVEETQDLEHREQEARTEGIITSDAEAQRYATWSSWLGSYLSQPVETTTITYAAGLAPSITSSVSSSNVPEADETLPPTPPTPEEPTRPVHTPSSPTLQRINPILDVMPRSTWSSFFTTRHLPVQKAIDNKSANDSGEVENMEIDFGSLAASEVIGTAAYMLPSASQSSTSTSSRTATALSTSTSAAVTVQSASGSSTSTIKPLTKDKKGSKGSTIATANKGKSVGPPKPARPNLVLPTFEETFDRPPRSLPLTRSPATSPSGLKKAVTASLTYFFSSTTSRPRSDSTGQAASLKGKEREIIGDEHEKLPKANKIVGPVVDLGRAGRVAVIGVHGWFIQGYLKNVVGEPTGTSLKFASMMKASVKAYYDEMGHPLNDEAITAIPLEGDGTVKDRTERLYENLMARQDWIEALNNADRVFIASHSQGTIVSAMLIERLINEGEINGTKVMMLNMCSVSQGPFYSLYNSWTVPAYLYFETAAATELFEFQKPSSAVSKAYTESMKHILNAGVKILFVASLNDQVVPLYSALFSSLSHPNILRTIFIDSSVFDTNADFMTNLVVFSTRLRNAGLNCHGLDFHLSEALMGSLVGVGHSTVYEEPLVYKYAVRYLMETTTPLSHGPAAFTPSGDVFKVEDFNPRAPANPFFLPWALRGIIEDPQIRALFSDELQTLRDQFEEWRPKTKALQQVQAALEPLRLIPRSAKSENELEEALSATDKKATAKL